CMRLGYSQVAPAAIVDQAVWRNGTSVCRNQSAIAEAAALIPSHATANSGTSVFMNQSATAAAAALIAPQTVSQIWRPVSVLVKKRTSPATRAAIATTTSPIGLARIAAFKSHCAT